MSTDIEITTAPTVHLGRAQATVNQFGLHDPLLINGCLYSRQSIADACGVHISTISKIFKGTRRPSLSLSIRIAAHLGVSVEFLITRVLPYARIK